MYLLINFYPYICTSFREGNYQNLLNCPRNCKSAISNTFGGKVRLNTILVFFLNISEFLSFISFFGVCNKVNYIIMNKKIILVGVLLGTTLYQAQKNESKIQEVTIVNKIPQQLGSTGKNVTLLTKDDLEKYKGQYLNDVLNQVIGFQVTGSNNNQTEVKTMRVRGGTNKNVLILLDGVPLKDNTAIDNSLQDIRLLSLESVESIEILNGAGSVLYGSNATVSVINIKTKQNTDKNIEGAVSLRGGSFHTYAQDLSVRGKAGKFVYQLNGFNEKAEGLSSASGDETFDKDGWEKQNLRAFVGYRDKNFQANVNAGWNHHLYQFDEGAFSDGNKRADDKQFFIGANADLNYNKGKLVFNFRHSDNDRLYQDLVSEKFLDKNLYRGKNLFAEFYNSYYFNEFVTGTVGVQFDQQKMASSSLPWGGSSMQDNLKFSDTKLHSVDAFANANFKYNIFRLDAGVRWINNSKFKSDFVYSLNPYLFVEKGNVYYKLGYSYSTAFIAPSLYQTYGSLPYTISNDNIKPEKNASQEIDLSFGTLDKMFNLRASFFQRNEKDAIAYVTVNPVNYTGQYQNIDTNKVKGFEVGLDFAPVQQIRLGGNFSFVEKEKEVTMRRQPKQRINSFLEFSPYNTTRINFSHMFVSNLSDVYYDSQTFNTVNVENKAYHLFNLNINQTIHKNINAYINIGNLFNTSYVDVVGYTTKPRNYTVGVSYLF